jgi:hypothetical protein
MLSFCVAFQIECDLNNCSSCKLQMSCWSVTKLNLLQISLMSKLKEPNEQEYNHRINDGFECIHLETEFTSRVYHV